MLTMVLAVIAATYFGGTRSGLIAIILSLLVDDYFFTLPLHQLHLNRSELSAAILYVLVAGGIVLINHRQSVYHAILLQQSKYDALTDLPNRRFFTETLEKMQQGRRISDRKIAVIIMDLNNFKQINDRFGHHAGDDVLREFSRKLKSCIRSVDFAARWGGDEFAVILVDVENRASLTSIAEKIRESTTVTFTKGKTKIKIDACLGVVHNPASLHDVDRILRRADRLMYQAKKANQAFVISRS